MVVAGVFMLQQLLFLSHFEFFCGQLLNRHMAKWDLFVINKETKKVNDIIYASVLQLIINENQSKCESE